MDRHTYRIWNEDVKEYGSLIDITVPSSIPTAYPQHHVLEQCTGIKDCKGRVIFEGDIIRFLQSRSQVKRGDIFKITWEGSRFGFSKTYELTVKTATCCEIIGNIHQNPRLLEVLKK